MTGLRERQKAARHDALVEAARDLVRAASLDAVTIEEICERVGVSPRTFFNYFASKEDAVLGLPQDDLGASELAVAAFVAGGPTGDLLDDGADLVLSMLRDPRLHPDRVMPVLELLEREPRLLARHVVWIEAQRCAMEDLLRQREHARASGVEPAVAATVLASLLRAAVATWLDQGRDGTPADHLSHVTDQVRRLVATTNRSSS